MADSEVRQKFEARMQKTAYWKPEDLKVNDDGEYTWAELRDYWKEFSEGFEAGMRAGEIARWIPVEEKLPEITKHFGPGGCYGESPSVLAFTTYNGQTCVAVSYASGEWATAGGSRLPRVTHWQPLPAAPEEKK